MAEYGIFSMQFPAQENHCDVCGKVTLQVHVGHKWRCNECGFTPELAIGDSGQKLHKGRGNANRGPQACALQVTPQRSGGTETT
jgi:hypothetical protein